MQGSGCLDFVLVNLSSFKRHLLVMGPECPCRTVHIIVELYPVGADEVNFTDICCPIYDTGHSGGLLGFEGRKSRGVCNSGTIFL